MFYKQMKPNKKLKEAFKLVLKELKNNGKCPTYSIGCYQCSTQRLYEDLKGYYEMIIVDIEIK